MGSHVPVIVRSILNDMLPLLHQMRSGQVFVNDAKVLAADVPAGNSIVHIINKASFDREDTKVHFADLVSPCWFALNKPGMLASEHEGLNAKHESLK